MAESGWTPETLHQHFTAVLAERDKALVAAVSTMEKRLDGMNEFRDQLRDQAASFIRREEHELLATQVASVQQLQANLQGRITTAALVVGGLFALATLAAQVFFRH